MDRKPLTRRQRQILFLMREADGPVMITGGTRRFYWGRPTGDHPGALVIKAYQDPDLWLRHRGLIEAVPMNAPGTWYRLTEDGQRRAATIGKMPS